MPTPSVTGVTIDAIHSRDLDDALWVERDGEGWRVTVCVADVAAHVLPGSAEDAEARALGQTRYAASEARLPMLPREISEGGLSLSPGNIGDVLAFHATLGPDLGIRSLETEVATLDHAGRLDHASAAALIDGGNGAAVPRMLRRASSLAEALLEARQRAGALAFFSRADALLADEDGRIVDLGASRGSSVAYVLVQEMMILLTSSPP